MQQGCQKVSPSHRTSDSQTVAVASIRLRFVALFACPCRNACTWLMKNNILYYIYNMLHLAAAPQLCRSAGGPGQPVILVGWSNRQQPPMKLAFPLGKAAIPSVVGREGGEPLRVSFYRILPEMPSALGCPERTHEPLNISRPNEVRHGKSVCGESKVEGMEIWLEGTWRRQRSEQGGTDLFFSLATFLVLCYRFYYLALSGQPHT